MRVLSLFSGIGGFDLGFERAGMSVIGMCEIDKYAQKILTRQFPSATLHTDVRKVSYERGAVDLICGGFPCQDLSVAGKRRGLAGNRSGLWHEFARIIDEAEPAWVVVENVPGLFSSNDGRDFAVIVDWLAQRGYGVGWRVLDAQGFGLAQRRKRVFIVASFRNPRGCTVLLEPESVRRDSAQSRQAGQGRARAVAHGTNHDIAYTLRGPSGIQSGNGIINTNIVPVTYAIQGNIVDREHGGAHGTGIATNAPMYTLTSTDRHAVAFKMRTTGGNPTGERGGKNTHPGGSGYLESDKAFTLATTHDQLVAVQDISPTLRAEAKQSLMSGNDNINAPLAIAINGQHPKWSALHEQSHTLSTTRVEQVISVGVRRLTPTECERLQGFPDGWTDGQSDAQRYKQLGNAVAVPVAEWIGRRIIGGNNAT